MSSSQSGLADLFVELVDLPPEARAARLAEVEDEALRAEVEGLLDADATAGHRLARLDLLAPALGSGDLVGTYVGRVRIDEEIGRGGMGVVYRGRDERLARDVAVKVLPRALAADAEARARLEAEARAASALDHPNVCTVHALEETDDGALALVMAHYLGETLKARIARGPLPAEEAESVSRQIAAGLAAAHAAGVVHRDVKPSNVLLGADGVVRVLDFGIARSVGSDLTATGATLGTASYMAPEQTRGVRADARADVWALGVVLHEMLTGAQPFAGRGEVLIHAIRHDEPAPLPAATPSHLRAAVARALAKDPDARPADAAMFFDCLDATPPASVRWRRPLAYAVVALVIAAGLWWMRPGPSVPDDEFVIAIAPFAAVGDGADAEADVMQALVWRELDRILADEGGVRVVEAGDEAPRSTAEATTLGEAVGAHLVVWGEAVVLRGEVEVRPELTRAVPFEAFGEDIGESGPAVLLVDASSGDQLASRRTKAAEVGDLALLIAANYHVGRGDLERARALLGRVRQPDANTTALRAWIAHFDNDHQVAVPLYRQALAQDSTLSSASMGLGIALMDLGQVTDAERVLRRGLAITPEEPGLTAMLAWAVAYQGRMDEAVALARAATRQAPDSQLGQISLGWSQFMSGDLDVAAETFGTLAETTPNRRTAAMGYYGVAVVQVSRGDPEAAEVGAREAVRRAPRSGDYLFFLGQIGLVRDDLALAAEGFERLLALDRPSTYTMDATLYRAYAWARMGRTSLGLDAVADTLASHPFAPLVAYAHGRTTEAEVLAAASTPDPTLGRDWCHEAHLHLGHFAEAGVGGPPDRARALDHYRRAEALYEGTSEISMAAYARRRLEDR